MVDETDIGVIIAERIRTSRKNKGLTQAQLAEKCDMSTEAIKKIEKGNHNCYVSTLVKLSQSLEVSCDYIVGNESYSVIGNVNQALLAFNERELCILSMLLEKYKELFSQTVEEH